MKIKPDSKEIFSYLKEIQHLCNENPNSLDNFIKTHNLQYQYYIEEGYLFENKGPQHWYPETFFNDIKKYPLLTYRGKIFYNKYQSFLGKIELWAKDYPYIIGSFLFGIFGGIIGFILTKLIEKLF